MCTLELFSPPPEDGDVTVCEFENTFINLSNGDPTVHKFLDKIAQYPKIEIPGDILKSQSSRESAKTAFLESKSSVSSKIVAAWWEFGLHGILEELSLNQEQQQVAPWLQSAAQWFLVALRGTTSLYKSLFPHKTLSNEDLINEFSPVANWRNCVLRAFAWHPGVVKFAIALCDDSIRIYSLKNAIVPTLKHSQQKRIADLAWKPFSASVLAVACQHSILIWTIEPSSLITRPSANCVQVLQQSGHQPVTGIAWNPFGTLLLSSSVASTSMMVWDIALEECVPLWRRGGGGVSLIKWAPNASLVFSATPLPLFRVWETQKWTCETWHNLDGRCQAACWSSDSSVVLFATKNEPVIYALAFQDAFDISSKIGGSKAAIPVIDLREVTFKRPEGGIVRVGGCVHSMEWDPNGERLAVTLTEKDGQTIQRFVAVFRTRMKPLVEIAPCGFLAGPPDCIPQLISFQKKCDNGAVLVVGWSNRYSGSIHLQFVPFSFTLCFPPSDIQPITVSRYPDSSKKSFLFASEPTLKLH